MSASLDGWINENLHKILGMSDKATVEYIKTISKSAKSADSIVKGLLDLDFPSNPTTTGFASELYNRLNTGPI